jgi:hypothetical protein
MHFKKRLFIITAGWFIAVTVLLSSCAKEGPQGIPGPQGDSGVAGLAGPAGADGSVIYSGNGAPSLSLGKNGDYYLDKSNGNLYGPKTDSGWGTPLVLGAGQGNSGGQGSQGPQGPQGPQGAQGNPGSQTFSGSGAPGATLGSIGDYYLDKTNFLLYGPKTAAGWGIPILLRGAQGPQGPAGPAGVAGSQIYSGTGAPAANLGQIGDYYLDKSNGNFYGPKTANGWGSPIALGNGSGSGSQGPAGPQGPQGPAGPQGPGGPAGPPGSQGPAGPQGPPGSQGHAGPKGSAGPQGPQGPAGPQGSQGAAGAAGATGAAGAAGSQIYSGSGAPPAATGKTGDYYIDNTHAILYGPKTAAGWPATGLSLQVNNTITYDFADKVSHNLPYNWAPPTIFADLFTGGTDFISLPYNNTSAQTLGFTIPQAIVDNGIVLCYIRYFTGPASDTATDAGKTAWTQLPAAISYFIGGEGIFPLNIQTFFDDNAFHIGIYVQDGTVGTTYAGANTVADVRIVLVPGNQINTIQSINPNLKTATPVHMVL